MFISRVVTYANSLRTYENPRCISKPTKLKPVLVVTPNAIPEVCAIGQKDADGDDWMVQNEFALPRLDHVLIIVRGELVNGVFAISIGFAKRFSATTSQGSRVGLC